VNPAGA